MSAGARAGSKRECSEGEPTPSDYADVYCWSGVDSTPEGSEQQAHGSSPRTAFHFQQPFFPQGEAPKMDRIFQEDPMGPSPSFSIHAIR